MIIVLSPAKTLDYGVDPKSNHTAPQFLSQSSNSDKLAVLNFDRYQSWKASKIVSADTKPSLMVFKGDVYQGLDAETLNNKQIKFAQKHLRILSGLYGILRPMDVIKPYRLEMGTKLETSKGKIYMIFGET